VRGPAFKALHDDWVQPTVQALRDDPAGSTIPFPDRSPEQVAAEAIEHITSDTFRLTKMLKIVRSISVAFGSMHWTLVAFDRRRLVTSDHPVVVWPLSRGRARPRPNVLRNGVTNALEGSFRSIRACCC
jgi:hypothetical protein